MLLNLLQAVADSASTASAINAAEQTEKTLSYLELATKGGWLMIVLLILSIIAIYIFGSKWWMISKFLFTLLAFEIIHHLLPSTSSAASGG